MEENKHLAELFGRYLDGTATDREIAELFVYANDPDYAPAVNQVIADAFAQQREETAIAPEKISQMLTNIFEEAGDSNIVPIRKSSLWKRITIAASVILCISAGAVLLLHKHQADRLSQVQQTIIQPGSNKAILTLANGSQITLNNAPNGKLATQGNTSVNKTSNGTISYHNASADAAITYNTLSTPKGGQYHLILADGTKVWLNAASSIRYPAAFAGGERTVEITGEAYFEVAHNPHAPFKVIAAGQVVQDIGTSFNINAYADEPAAKTTLVSGIVEVSLSNTSKKLRLKPGQQAINAQGSAVLTAANVDTQSAIAWRDGFFRFDNADLGSIMRQFARWYNIEVQYEGKISEHEFVGRISRNSSLQKVLKILAEEGIHYRLEDHKLTILP